MSYNRESIDISASTIGSTAIDLALLSQKREGPIAIDPVTTLGALTGSAITCGSVREQLSEKRPVWRSTDPDEEEWIPIDVLFGSYAAKKRRIEIYFNNINAYAKKYRWSPDDLTFIVRLHEYSHAFVHVAIPCRDLDNRFGQLDSKTGSTDWPTFIRSRNEWFAELQSPAHELLAQALTYSALARIEGTPGHRLIELFELLEAKQPPKYFVPTDLKTTLPDTDWNSVLLALHFGPRLFNYSDGDDRQYAEAILRNASRGAIYPGSDIDADVTSKLRTVLLEATSGDPEVTVSSHTSFRLHLQVAKIGGLRIHVYSREHPPPHFKIEVGNQSANYRIDNGDQLNGGLQRYQKVIAKWYKENRTHLIECWNKTRPTDCPVGIFRSQ